MAAKGDDGETDNLEVGGTDLQSKTKKRNPIHALQKAPRKLANAMTKKKVAPGDCAPKEEEPKPSAQPTEDASRLTVSDIDSSDVNNQQGLSSLVVCLDNSLTKPSGAHLGSYPPMHAPSSPTPDSTYSSSSSPQTHGLLPLVSGMTDQEHLSQGKSQVQPSGTSPFSVLPGKAKADPLTDYQLQLQHENSTLKAQAKEMQNTNFVLKAEKEEYAKQLAMEKARRREEKEDAKGVIADAEKRLAQETAKLVTENQKLAQALQTKSKENIELVQQLPLKEDHRRQLEETVAQRENELYNLHQRMAEIKAHYDKQVQKVDHDLQLSCQQVAILEQQVINLQQHQSDRKMQVLATDMKRKEEQIKQLKETNAVLQEQLDHAEAELQKKTNELKSSQEVIAEAKQAKEVEKATLLAQETKSYQDLSRRFAKGNLQVTQLQAKLQQKEDELKTTVENMNKEIATLTARLEAPNATWSLGGGGGATASRGPSNLEEEQKKVSLLEDSMKTSDEELQLIKQEKANLERELRDERVAKNLLENEKARLVAELQAVPDETVWTARITEHQRELQHVRSEKEELHREVCKLKHQLAHGGQPSQNAHILREKENKINELEVALKREKRSMSDLEEMLRQKENTICKLEVDLRESQKGRGEEKKEEKKAVVEQLTAQLQQLKADYEEAKLDQESAVKELVQLRARYENLQKWHGNEKAAYNREVELHEKTTQNWDKARKKATELRTIGQSQEAELIDAREQLVRAESQLAQLVAEKEVFTKQMERTLAAKDRAVDRMKQELVAEKESLKEQMEQLVAEKESLKEQMECTLAAKDDALDRMKQDTDEIRMQMQQKFTQITVELASATDCVNSKEVEIQRLRDELGVSQMQAMTFKADFEEERRDRGRIGGQMEEYKASVAKLETAVNQLHTQNQHLRDQIERLLKQNRDQEEKLSQVRSSKKELHSQVDTLNEELQTARAQIRGYKTQSDGLRKELEDLKNRAQNAEEILQQTLQQHQEDQREKQEKVTQLERELDSEKKSLEHFKGQATQLERELDSEKKNHEHFKGAFNKATAMMDDLRAKIGHLEGQLRVLQHQNAQLTEYQRIQEAKKSRARHALAQPENLPLASPLVASDHPPPAHMGHETGRGFNSRGQHVIPGHGEAGAVHHHRSSAIAPQQQFQQALPPSYHQQQPQPQQHPYLQGPASAGQGYSGHGGPSSLGITSHPMPVNGNAYQGQKARSSNVPVPHPTPVSDPTPPHSDQPVFQSSVNVRFPKAPHSQFPPQYGRTNAHPSTQSKLHPSSNAQSNVPPASRQTDPRAQDNHNLQVQKSSASRPIENPPENQATLVDNPLMDNIDQDIAEVAGEVRDMSKPPSTMQHSLHQDQHLPHQQQLQGEPGFEIPLDPNLVCSKCNRMFRHGEIQKLRKHFDQCRGKL